MPLVLATNTNPGQATWTNSSALSGSFLAANEYYVDSSLAADDATNRMYKLIASAIAAAEAEQLGNVDVLIRLREGQAHTWNMSGFVTGSILSYTIFSQGYGSSDAIAASIVLTGGTASNAADAGFGQLPVLRYQNVTIVQSGNVDYGLDRALTIVESKADFAGWNTTITNSGGFTGISFFVRNSVLTDLIVVGTAVNYNWINTIVNHDTSFVIPVIFAGVNDLNLENCAFDVSAQNFTLFQKAAGKAGAPVSIKNCTIRTDQSAAGAALLFDTGAGGGTVYYIFGLFLSVLNSGGGTTDWYEIGPVAASSVIEISGARLLTYPAMARRVVPSFTTFTPVIATAAAEQDLVTPIDVSGLLVPTQADEGLSEAQTCFKLRWFMTCTDGGAAVTAVIRVRLGVAAGGTIIAQSTAVNAATGNVQNGEINFDVSSYASPNAVVHATGYMTQIAAPTATGVTLSGINLGVAALSAGDATIRITVEWSGVDTTTLVLNSVRIDGTPVTRSGTVG